jgi:hypothetical protein
LHQYLPLIKQRADSRFVYFTMGARSITATSAKWMPRPGKWWKWDTGPDPHTATAPDGKYMTTVPAAPGRPVRSVVINVATDKIEARLPCLAVCMITSWFRKLGRLKFSRSTSV